MALTIRTETVGDACVCIADGPIDTPGAEQVKAWLEEAILSGVQKLIFDLARVPYVASAGLVAFMRAMKSFRGKVVFLAPQQHVRQTFRMNVFDRYAWICETREDALKV
jgi:anti-anti-sigma factor